MGHRSAQSAMIMVRWLNLEPVSGPVLCVDDEGRVIQWCNDRGVSHQAWFRDARYGQALACPPDGPFAAALLRLPKSREAQRMVLHQVGARLREDAVLYLYGHNDEGIKSAHKPASEVFEEVESVDARKHCRILRCGKPKSGLMGGLDEWSARTEVELPDGPLDFVSWPGLFAHGRLDQGTELLLGALPSMEPGTRVLDWACGAGVVAKVLGRRNPDIQLDALDVDALAVHAARINVPQAGQVYLSDAWSGVPKRRWDRIVSNPPLHTGVGTDHTALRALIAEAPRRMGRKGQLWLVAQRNVRLRAMLEDGFPSVRVAASTAGFKVWVASN